MRLPRHASFFLYPDNMEKLDQELSAVELQNAINTLDKFLADRPSGFDQVLILTVYERACELQQERSRRVQNVLHNNKQNEQNHPST